MKLKSFVSFGLLAVMPISAENVTGRISGPVLGYVKRSTGVRPIVGIPGASYFAPALELNGLEVAAIASESGYAILLTADRVTARIVALPSTVPIRMFGDLGSAITGVRLSTSGTAAALVRERYVDILSGLPNNPALNKTVELPAGTVAVAVSDDGDALAVTEGTSISLFDGNGQRQLVNARAVHDLHFLQGSREVMYIDGESVMLATSAGVRTIAGAADNLSSPQAALFSRDGRIVLIADSTSVDLLITQPSGRTVERVKLPCVPSELKSLNDSTFRLSCADSERIHLVQLTSNGAQVLFVPEPVE